MSTSTSKDKVSLRARWLVRPSVDNGSAVRGPVTRLVAQVREAIVAPLRPFPFAPATDAPGVGLGFRSPPDTGFMRDGQAPAAPPPLSAMALQHAHTLMSQLPAWMPMPETRRNQQGQVVLCWQGDQSRQFSVVVDADGMLIYAARLGSRGRFDGAEPIGRQLSPIILHAVERLREVSPLPR